MDFRISFEPNRNSFPIICIEAERDLGDWYFRVALLGLQFMVVKK